MNVWQVIVGCLLLVPVIYVGFGIFVAMALEGNPIVEWIMDWFVPLLFFGVLVGCLVGGVWLIYSGLH